MLVALFEGVDHRRGDLTVEIRTGHDPMTLISAGGQVYVTRGPAPHPDLVLTGPPDSLAGLIAGRIDRAHAEARGVSMVGDARKLSRLRPSHRPGTPPPGGPRLR